VAIHTSVKTVTTTAAAITGDIGAFGRGQSILITWLSGSGVYLGGPTVASTGTDNLGALINADNPTFAIQTDEAIYAKVESSTATVHVFRTRG
jgi:hypothetical protein